MKLLFALVVSAMMLLTTGLREKSHDQEAIDEKDLVKHLEKNFVKKMRRSPHLAKGHFRETVTKDDVYTGYFESIGYAMYMGEKNGNVAPYTKYKFFCENTMAKTETAPATTSTLRESLRFRYYGPFSNHKHSKFSFKIIDSESTPEYVTLKCSGKKLLNHMINFSDMYIRVDRENLQVLEVSYKTNTMYSMVFDGRLDGDVVIKYTYINEEPFVSSIETLYKKNNVVHKTFFEVIEQKLESFDLNKDEFWAFNTIDRFPYIDYNESQWDELQISLPDDYDKILNDLDGLDAPIGQYFVDNQSKSLPTSPIANQKSQLELAMHKMSELKNFFN